MYCCDIVKTILENPNTASWVGSLATLGAVIVALFLQEIRSIWDRPKLNLSINLAGC